MTKSNILESIFTKSIDHLIVRKKPLPSKEVLKLYRDVLKFTTEFYWKNEKGEVWRDVLRKSARKEFEEARHEKDIHYLNKMMVTTRESMEVLREKLINEYKKGDENFKLKINIMQKEFERENMGKNKATDLEFNTIK